MAAVCHQPRCFFSCPVPQFLHRIHPSNRRLSSSQIPEATGTASCLKNEVFGNSGHSGHILTPTVSGNSSVNSPIGSSGGDTIPTNVEPRPNGSGTSSIRLKSDPHHHWTGSLHRGIAANNSVSPGLITATARRAEEVFSRASLAHGQNLRRNEARIHSGSSLNTDWDPKFHPSSTIVLSGVGSALVEGDIRCLVPRKKHLPSFKDDTDILQVISYRDVNSLERRSLYQLVFNTPAAAQIFMASISVRFTQPRKLWPPALRFPPASEPRFSWLDARSLAIANQQVIIQNLFTAGASAKSSHGCGCVLLTAYGPGGNSKALRLPRTVEVRMMLEKFGTKLCLKNSKERGVGIERILEKQAANGAKDNQPLKESRWVIRCYSESEAHRVMRILHKAPPWQGSACIFRAEVI